MVAQLKYVYLNAVFRVILPIFAAENKYKNILLNHLTAVIRILSWQK